MKLTHRRTENELNNDFIMLFAVEGNEDYGDHCWDLRSSLPTVPAEVVEFCAKFYQIDTEEAEELINPEDIVSSAGAWDDPDFVSELWQEMEMNQIKESVGFLTPDGAVVLDKDGVDLKYSFDGAVVLGEDGVDLEYSLDDDDE